MPNGPVASKAQNRERDITGVETQERDRTEVPLLELPERWATQGHLRVASQAQDLVLFKKNFHNELRDG